MSKSYVYDYETICNCFVAVFEELEGSDRKVFIFHPIRNDFDKYLKFLEQNIKIKDRHCGFNSIKFDGQITEFILRNKKEFKELHVDALTKRVYDFAQETIRKTSTQGGYPEYREDQFKIPTTDIFAWNNWDSNAKRASLKWLQFTMNWYNVQEMPHAHSVPVETVEQLKMIVDYCINDVRSTKNIFRHQDAKGNYDMLEQMQLRADLSKEYKINLHSAPEPKIGKEMFLHFLSKKLGVTKNSLRYNQTIRDKVYVGEIILPYIKFQIPEFQQMFNWAKALILDIKSIGDDEEKKGPKYTLSIGDTKSVYGLGGIHGCITPGVYKSSKGKIIKSADVTSFYPNLAIRNRWSPAHIANEIFCDLYEWFFEERKKYPKGSSLNYLFKIILNAVYGLSKNRYSFLYDPQFTYRITMNGQLLLTMLYETVLLRIPGAVPLMQNTDGLEFLIDEGHEAEFDKICREWEVMTKLQLEVVTYDKMIIADVNSYIAVYHNGKTKCKGRFEFEDKMLHKNSSLRIVPMTIYNYFVNHTPIEEFLATQTNIFDFCAGAKLKRPWKLIKQFVKDSAFTEEPLSRIVRYYYSNKGCKLIKRHPDGREIQLESGTPMLTVYNIAHKKDFNDYDLDMSIYLKQIMDEIEKIEIQQTKKVNELTLF